VAASCFSPPRGIRTSDQRSNYAQEFLLLWSVTSRDEKGKARFNALGPEDNPDQQQVQRNLTQVCSERASGIASLPLERIERGVRPDEAQPMLRAVQTVQPALEKFYASLGDEQKERFNRLSPAQG
jgi:LTXXQ motif family protein